MNTVITAKWMKLCLLLAAIPSGLLPQSTSADQQVPFRASFSTVFQSVVEFPNAHIFVVGQGKGLHLGATTSVTTDSVVNLITGEGLATYVFAAADGSTLELELFSQATFILGGVSLEGTYIIVGGSGRFSGATGAGSWDGLVTFLGPNTGVGQMFLSGTISPPGRL